jgi:hypothetical protein
MSLEGYLEDLGISDILQIVSLSKKSGTLTLESNHGRGAITFVDGQVVRAACDQYPEELGQLLRRCGLVSQEQIDQALNQQRSLKNHKPLGAILADSFQIPSERIDAVVERQIEQIVLTFFSWQDGTFAFDVGDQRNYGSSCVNPLDFMLEKGICPQWLIVKGQQDEEAGAPLDEVSLRQQARQLERRIENEDISLLRGMLAELDNPFLGGGIILLILRYASEIMTRAVIFDVRGRQMVGLGQFGLAGLSAPADEMVRKMRITIEPDSLFGRVLHRQAALRGSLGSARDERSLLDILGGSAAEVFLAPLVSENKVVAILFGDNGPDGAPIGCADAFEVFLSQAGLAMEQALSQRESAI